MYAALGLFPKNKQSSLSVATTTKPGPTASFFNQLPTLFSKSSSDLNEEGLSYLKLGEKKEAFESFNKALELDAANHDAKCNLADCYLYGRGVNKNPGKAFQLYMEAAKNNFSQAMYKLGICYKYGNGTEKNHKLAFDWFCDAGNRGYPEAIYMVAIYYMEGETFAPKNPEHAISLFKEASDKGYVHATYSLGMYYYQEKDEKKYPDALGLFIQASHENYSPANYMLGIFYLKGIVIPKNPVYAINLFRKSAGNDYAKASYALGKCYEEGIGVDKSSKEEAFHWYKKAAEDGYPEAMFYTGMYYRRGDTVDKSDLKAGEWFVKGANRKNLDSMIELGILYKEREGCIVSKEDKEGFELNKLLFGGSVRSSPFELFMEEEELLNYDGNLMFQRSKDLFCRFYNTYLEKKSIYEEFKNGTECLYSNHEHDINKAFLYSQLAYYYMSLDDECFEENQELVISILKCCLELQVLKPSLTLIRLFSIKYKNLPSDVREFCEKNSLIREGLKGNDQVILLGRYKTGSHETKKSIAALFKLEKLIDSLKNNDIALCKLETLIDLLKKNDMRDSITKKAPLFILPKKEMDEEEKS